MRIFLLSVLILFCSADILFADTSVLLPDTPVWRSPDISHPVAFVSTEQMIVNPISKFSGYWEYGPTCMEVDVLCFMPSNQPQKLWYSPQIKYQNGTLQYRTNFDSTYYCCSLICLLAACSAVFLFCRKRKSLSETSENIFAVSCLLLIYYFLFFCFRTHVPYFRVPTDEQSYYSQAFDLMNFSFSGKKWIYPIGHPLLLVPFAFFSKQPNIYEMIRCFSMTGALIITPAAIVLCFAVLRRLTKNVYLAAGSLLFLFTTASFFLCVYRINSFSELLYVNAVYYLPSLDIFFSFFQKAAFFSYCGLSDMPSAAIIFFCILLAFLLKRPFFPISIIYSFSILVRTANLCFAPIIVFLLLYRYRKQIRDFRYLLKFCLTGLAVFALIMLPQLIVQKVQLGGFLTSPYALHTDGAANGFSWRLAWDYGICFVVTANYAWIVPSVSALLCMKRKIRRSILILASIPVYMFFCGYYVVLNDAFRWFLPVFPFSAAAIFMGEWWIGQPKRKLFAAIFAVVFALLLTAPCSYGTKTILPWSIERLSCGIMISHILTGVSAAILCAVMYYVRRNRDLLCFLLVFSVLYLSASPILIFCSFAVLILRTAADSLHLFLHYRIPFDSWVGKCIKP